jgi:hypothetical protein
MFFRYFPLKNSSMMQTMQRFLKENYRKNLSVKIIHINSVMYLAAVTDLFLKVFRRKKNKHNGSSY